MDVVRKALTGYWRDKAFALGAAVLLWYYLAVHTTRTAGLAEEAQADVQGVQVLVTAPPSFPYRVRVEGPEVSVRVRGTPASVAAVEPRSLVVSVLVDPTVHRPREGDAPYRVRATVRAPDGITVVTEPEVTFVVMEAK